MGSLLINQNVMTWQRFGTVQNMYSLAGYKHLDGINLNTLGNKYPSGMYACLNCTGGAPVTYSNNNHWFVFQIAPEIEGYVFQIAFYFWGGMPGDSSTNVYQGLYYRTLYNGSWVKLA